MILKKQPIIFADDTSLTATGKDLDVLLQRINSELQLFMNGYAQTG